MKSEPQWRIQGEFYEFEKCRYDDKNQKVTEHQILLLQLKSSFAECVNCGILT